MAWREDSVIRNLAQTAVLSEIRLTGRIGKVLPHLKVANWQASAHPPREPLPRPRLKGHPRRIRQRQPQSLPNRQPALRRCRGSHLAPEQEQSTLRRCREGLKSPAAFDHRGTTGVRTRKYRWCDGTSEQRTELMRPRPTTRLMRPPQSRRKSSRAKAHYGSFINVETRLSA